MNTLVVATRNLGKLKEIRSILGDAANLRSLKDYPDAPEVTEDGQTFEANAIKKALVIARVTQLPAIADDSGLAVDALGGAPGVHSARYAGEGATDAANNEKLLGRLRNVASDQRTCRFRCAIAVARPDGRVETVQATWEGLVLSSPRGQYGFGYDPLFLDPSLGRTAAELLVEEKNRVGHRGQALKAALPLIRRVLHSKSS